MGVRNEEVCDHMEV